MQLFKDRYWGDEIDLQTIDLKAVKPSEFETKGTNTRSDLCYQVLGIFKNWVNIGGGTSTFFHFFYSVSEKHGSKDQLNCILSQ